MDRRSFLVALVAAPLAHPFYALAAAQGFAPDWNFHKILLDREGRMVAQFDRFTAPEGPELVEAIEALLPQGRCPPEGRYLSGSSFMIWPFATARSSVIFERIVCSSAR
jgi:hypothetical protein